MCYMDKLKNNNNLFDCDNSTISRRDFFRKSVVYLGGTISLCSTLNMVVAERHKLGCNTCRYGSSSLDAVNKLIRRRFPMLIGKIQFEEIFVENSFDVFELQSVNGILVIRGNNGVSMASGLNWYLKHYCNCQITFRDKQLSIPNPLPNISDNIRIVSPYKYRYYFNYCAFAYTFAWWDWNDWEWMIDLMALYGINAPLAITGLEGVWRNVGKRLQLSEEQMQDFYVGPGYLPFGWMGCIDRWGGPLPDSWIDDHVELQKKILSREREFGMTPVMQGFTGHVPRKLGDVDKDVNLIKLSPWVNFESTYFIDPVDPYFVKIGKIFMEEQIKLFGSDHLYASDSFIEMPPTNSDPDFICKMGQSIYESMSSVDPAAIWVLQSWPFVHFNTQFWQPQQAKAFFTSVPQGKLLVLDLYCDVNPGWPKFENAFFGQPWIWCIIQNFGGQVSLHGGLDIIAADLKRVIEQREIAGNISGIGYAMEGLCYNSVIDDFLSDMIWRNSIPDTVDWLNSFIKRRYGKSSYKIRSLWGKLHKTVYQQNQIQNNILQALPSFTYKVTALDRTFVSIWTSLLACSEDIGEKDTFKFDVVNVTRHILGLLASLYYSEFLVSYLNKDRKMLRVAYEKLEGLMEDIDRILATNSEFLLGSWLESAKRWGRTESEKRQYEWNARKIISVWAFDGMLNDYAAKQWSGMMKDYYKRRWNYFYKSIDNSLANNEKWNYYQYEKEILRLQEDWTRETTIFPSHESGENPIALSKLFYKKYISCFDEKIDIPKYEIIDGVPELV